jgi:hypothetical protein
MLRLRSAHNALLPSAGIGPNKPIVVGMTLKSEAAPSAADADPAAAADNQHRRASSPLSLPPAPLCPGARQIAGPETVGNAVTSKRLYEVSVKLRSMEKRWYLFYR